MATKKRTTRRRKHGKNWARALAGIALSVVVSGWAQEGCHQRHPAPAPTFISVALER